MALITEISHLTNPSPTPDQLALSASALEGVPFDLQSSILYESCRLMQTAGVLLRLPQEVIAQAIVIFSRFWIGQQGGSLLQYDAKDILTASVYLVAKPSAYSVSPRRVITSVECALHFRSSANNEPTPESTYVSEGDYERLRTRLIKSEAQILRVLGFQIHVALPYTICINYLQALGALGPTSPRDVVRRAFAHLNAALLSPQLLSLTHQPNALAVAAIYLASREVGVKLPEVEWWEVFDVEREELGFLVVALTSMPGFAEQESKLWASRSTPLTAETVRRELKHRHEQDISAD